MGKVPVENALAWLTGKRTVKWALAVLVCLVIGDGVVTNVLVQLGIARERNPLLVVYAGKGALVLLKAAGAAVCALLLWDVYRHWRRLGVASILLFLLIYSSIVVWNFSLLINGLL